MLSDEVFAWLSRQPDWQRDLAHLVATQVELDGAEYEDALRFVKARFGVPVDGPGRSCCPIERDHVSPASVGAVPRLLALGSLQGVGLVSENDELTFGGTGLTLIYGQNAVGKSSYVRALKVICRTVDRDCRIRGNIYDASTTGTPPSARIKIDVDGALTELRTTLDGDAEVTLPGVSVFDSACAELYVSAQNAVQFIPAELRLLARLATLQDRMRHDIAGERQSLQGVEPSRDGYPLTTEVGRALARLRGAGDDPDLASLVVMTAEQEARFAELCGIIAAAAGSTIRDDAPAARREAGEARALAGSLSELVERAGDAAADRLRRTATDDARARAAVQLSVEQLTAPVPGIGDDPWRLMWDAARSFVEGHRGAFPPAPGDHCPLCLQPVTADTAERMAHFQEHVSSTIRATAKSAAGALSDALEACAPAHAAACRTPLIAALRDRKPELVQHVETLIDAVAEHLVTMQTDPAAAAGTTFDAEAVTAGLTAWADTRSSHTSALLAAEEPEKLKQAEAELAELEARQRLASELDIFTTWRMRLGTISALTEAHTALATNRITSARRELTHTEIGKALDAALTEELTRLSCTHLPVQLDTSLDVTDTKVGLRLLAHAPAGVSEVVSDGERRALALCFFFAELTVANEAGGIVVDDPVSSLDDDRRGYIADRLVAEAHTRQVIVFTHDLPFVFDLRTQAKKAGVPVHFQHMWRLGDDVGRVDDQPPFKTMNLRERIGKLDQELQQMRNEPPPADYEQACRRTTGFYHRVRTSWERAVEERLFAGVVERFERNVKTLLLKDVKITDELVDQVEQGMTRGSKFLHEGAFAAQVALPSLVEMAQEVETLRKFDKSTRPTGG